MEQPSIVVPLKNIYSVVSTFIVAVTVDSLSTEMLGGAVLCLFTSTQSNSKMVTTKSPQYGPDKRHQVTAEPFVDSSHTSSGSRTYITGLRRYHCSWSSWDGSQSCNPSLMMCVCLDLVDSEAGCDGCFSNVVVSGL